ncbi:unnamed protein product [Durusdinium trenchii]|uniref:Origin recognition complex-associated protein n=1 Tax=Durusdinium trenchii TaxID=1381693 RepID=A0ABP0SNR4_9DINO
MMPEGTRHEKSKGEKPAPKGVQFGPRSTGDAAAKAGAQARQARAGKLSANVNTGPEAQPGPEEDDSEEEKARVGPLMPTGTAEPDELPEPGKELEEKAVTAIGLDPKGSRMITGGLEGTLKFFDFHGMSEAKDAFRSVEPVVGKMVHAVSFSPTGGQVSRTRREEKSVLAGCFWEMELKAEVEQGRCVMAQAVVVTGNCTGSVAQEFILDILQKLGMPKKQAKEITRDPCNSRPLLECNGNGTIVSIVLLGEQLSGEIPKELGQLQLLQRLELAKNRLSGEIPEELGQLHSLWNLNLDQNQLSGKIPKQLSHLQSLEILRLGQNQLSGEIPNELSQLQSLQELDLAQNQLSGDIPKELGRLQSLRMLQLAQNQLSGEIPKELGQIHLLEELVLSQNQLSGKIPKELGKLHLLIILLLHQNRLNGKIPKELSQLQSLSLLLLHENKLSGQIPKELSQIHSLTKLNLAHNRLSGQIPTELGQLQSLKGLHLARNQLHGDLKEIIFNSTHLKSLDLSFNKLSGEPVFWLPLKELEELDFSHNRLTGSILKLVTPFCSMSPAGMSLQQLRLNHNKLSGELPPCLMQFTNLQLLALNNNHFSGAIPEVLAPELVVLALHKNYFTDHLPKGLEDLEHLGVLTLHENMFMGAIPHLNLTTPCIDNSRFSVQGWSCSMLKVDFWVCDHQFLRTVFGPHMFQHIVSNCPGWCDACQSGTANITFHRNRLSGNIPSSINRTDVLGLSIMGNMLGNGREVNASWILPEEKQPFLYYSPKVWNSHTQLLGGMYVLFFGMTVFSWPLRQKCLQTYRGLCVGQAALVVASNLAVLKAAGSAVVLACPLLLFFWRNAGYYAAAPPLWNIFAANFEADHGVDSAVVSCWCTMAFVFRTMIASMPKRSCSPATAFAKDSLQERLLRVVAWVCWFGIVFICSLPSILFAFSQSLPAHNSIPLSDLVLQWFNSLAPYLNVLIDMVLSAPVSKKYAAFTGIKADRLLMTFRLFSAWLLALLTTVVLDENCLSGWKWTWTVCQVGSPNHQNFNWAVFGEEILNTDQDICGSTDAWWSDGRCSRAIIGNLTPFLLKKLMVRATLQPLTLLMFWHCSKLDMPRDDLQGRHLKLFGRWRRTTGSLVPLQQLSLLTTHMEMLIVWAPLVPFLGFAILAAALANLFMFDAGLWSFQVTLPTDEMNRGAAISTSYLRFALVVGSFFQLWYAFGTQLFGRYALLASHIMVIGPWAKHFLPVDLVRRHFWTEHQTVSDVQVIEMAIQLDQEANAS